MVGTSHSFIGPVVSEEEILTVPGNVFWKNLEAWSKCEGQIQFIIDKQNIWLITDHKCWAQQLTVHTCMKYTAFGFPQTSWADIHWYSIEQTFQCGIKTQFTHSSYQKPLISSILFKHALEITICANSILSQFQISNYHQIQKKRLKSHLPSSLWTIKGHVTMDLRI